MSNEEGSTQTVAALSRGSEVCVCVCVLLLESFHFPVVPVFNMLHVSADESVGNRNVEQKAVAHLVLVTSLLPVGTLALCQDRLLVILHSKLHPEPQAGWGENNNNQLKYLHGEDATL